MMYFVKKSDMIQLYIMGKMQKCAKHKQLLIVLCIMGGKKKFWEMILLHLL